MKDQKPTMSEDTKLLIEKFGVQSTSSLISLVVNKKWKIAVAPRQDPNQEPTFIVQSNPDYPNYQTAWDDLTFLTFLIQESHNAKLTGVHVEMGIDNKYVFETSFKF